MYGVSNCTNTCDELDKKTDRLTQTLTLFTLTLLQHPSLPAEGALLPLRGRETVVANCANSLRYFGPAAALRSPQTDHFQQRRVSGSNPDLISTVVDADSRRAATAIGPVSNVLGIGGIGPDGMPTNGTDDASASPIPSSMAGVAGMGVGVGVGVGMTGLAVSTSSLSSGPGPLCPCCQAHPYPDCPHCQEETVPMVPTSHPELPHYSLLSTREASPQPASPRLVHHQQQPASDSEGPRQGHGHGQVQGLGRGRGQGRGRSREGDRERERERAEHESPRSSLPPGVVRMLRPLRKVSAGWRVGEDTFTLHCITLHLHYITLHLLEFLFSR